MSTATAVYDLIARIKDELDTVSLMVSDIERERDERTNEAAAVLSVFGGGGGRELLTAKDVQRLLKISPSTFYSWLAEGRISAGIPYGARSKRWLKDEILSQCSSETA